MADLRTCIGSTRFGIEPHEAPMEDFPKQPSQKDGLGRMCKVHWNQYTAALAREAKARKAAAGAEPPATDIEPTSSSAPVPTRKRRAVEAAAADDAQAEAGS
jgi:hypothetical protein